MNAPKSPFAGANQEPETPEPKKLKADDIRYLALEGGGGKGFAYLGAIDILEKVKGADGRSIMARVDGFAGASAGAITALLLSIGYDYKALTKFLSDTDFDSFFDPPRPRIRPQVGSNGVEIAEDSPSEQAFISGSIQEWTEATIGGARPGLGREILANMASVPVAIPDILGRHLLQQIARVGGLVNMPTAAKTILQDFTHYFAYLSRDMGLFSGKAARMLFEQKVQEAAVKKNGGLPSSYANMNFERHRKIFGKRLLVTGTNLRSGKTQLFSAENTPHFPVADAVRISMSLPLIFKPYVIQLRLDSTDPPCGVYVDGGVWNNLPFRELDSNPPAERPAASASVVSTKASTEPTPRTLGLRLEIDPAERVNSAGDILWQLMLNHGLFGSGESQVMDKYLSQCIVLDTRGLDLLTFSPPKDPRIALRIANRSRRAVCRYFDLDIDIIQPRIRDDADDQASYDARQKAETCNSSF